MRLSTPWCHRSAAHMAASFTLCALIGCQTTGDTTPDATTIYTEFLASKDSTEQEFLRSTGMKKVWGIPDTVPLPPGTGRVLLKEEFTSTEGWHHEGIGGLSLAERGVMELACEGSVQGGRGCMAFSRQRLPDSITLEFDLKVLSTRGLVIVMMAVEGTSGEDLLEDLPPRRGVFADYVFTPRIRSYHLSLSRYDDDGTHTGVSNWRRSPGLVLMGQQEDLCKEPGRWYAIGITKLGGRLQLQVNATFAGGFIDPAELPGPIPAGGRIGFRLIGDDVSAQIKHLRVRRYLRDPSPGTGPPESPPQDTPG